MNIETKIIKKGYNPHLSEGSLITPIFNSSTYCFKTAEDGARAFAVAYGKKKKKKNESLSLIYSRVNNPNMQILEEKLSVINNYENTLVFSSGMAAISNTCFTFTKPGDIILFSNPVYGGTEYLFNIILPKKGVQCIPFPSGSTSSEIALLIGGIEKKKIKIIFVETPCNPLLKLTSLKEIKKIKSYCRQSISVIDNTFAGPYYLKPSEFGCDITLYSVTKFIAGHSDVIAGSVSGSNYLLSLINETRTIMGSIPDPNTCWLIQRSLPTLKLRMDQQTENTLQIINFLKINSKIKKIYYPGINDKEIFEQEYSNSGSIFSFEVYGDLNKVYTLLNSCKIFILAVSLGGIESLIQHPATMTHSDMSQKQLEDSGISESLIRCSVGLENYNDLIYDLKQALDKI